MNKPICNVHVHTFNAQYMPDKFIGQFVGLFPKTITKILRNKYSGNALLQLLKRFNEDSKLGKYVAFLKVGIKESQYKIFYDLKTKEGYPSDTRFVVLPLNFTYMGAGALKIPYEHQLNDLIRVAVSARGKLLPFLCIDPRMGTAQENLNFVKRYVEEKGFMGLKIYPSLGFYPFDPKLELVYKYAEKHQLPIMTHCSSTGVFYNDNKNIPREFLTPKSFNPQTKNEFTGEDRVYEFEMPTKGILKKKDLAKFADNFLNPVNYTDVLQRFPKLKICFAHFGLDNDQHKSKKKDRMILSWHEDIKKLKSNPKYPNIYTDISYSSHFEDVRERFAGYMKDELLRHKILFGTDFFMTLQEVKDEREMLNKTIDSFGDDFEKIAADNVKGYLDSSFYNY